MVERSSLFVVVCEAQVFAGRLSEHSHALVHLTEVVTPADAFFTQPHIS